CYSPTNPSTLVKHSRCFVRPGWALSEPGIPPLRSKTIVIFSQQSFNPIFSQARLDKSSFAQAFLPHKPGRQKTIASRPLQNVEGILMESESHYRIALARISKKISSKRQI